MPMSDNEECLMPPRVKRIKSEDFDNPEIFGSPPKIRRSVNLELSRVNGSSPALCGDVNFDVFQDHNGNFSPPKLRRGDCAKSDIYDDYGRNLTEQMKRQNKVPWIKVKYNKRRLVIPEEKRILNTL